MIYRGITGPDIQYRPSESWTNQSAVAEVYARHSHDGRSVKNPVVKVGAINTENILFLPQEISGNELSEKTGIDMPGTEKFPTWRVMDDPEITEFLKQKFDIVAYPDVFTSKDLARPFKGSIISYRPLKEGSILNMREVVL